MHNIMHTSYVPGCWQGGWQDASTCLAGCEYLAGTVRVPCWQDESTWLESTGHSAAGLVSIRLDVREAVPRHIEQLAGVEDVGWVQRPLHLAHNIDVLCSMLF